MLDINWNLVSWGECWMGEHLKWFFVMMDGKASRHFDGFPFQKFALQTEFGMNDFDGNHFKYNIL